MFNVAVPSHRALVEVLGNPQGVGFILGVGDLVADGFGRCDTVFNLLVVGESRVDMVVGNGPILSVNV